MGRLSDRRGDSDAIFLAGGSPITIREALRAECSVKPSLHSNGSDWSAGTSEGTLFSSVSADTIAGFRRMDGSSTSTVISSQDYKNVSNVSTNDQNNSSDEVQPKAIKNVRIFDAPEED